MPQIGTKGAELDLLIKQGATFGPHSCQLLNPDSSPMNITGCTFEAQARKAYNSTDAQSYPASFTIVDATEGRFTWQFPAEVTAAMQAGPTEEHKDSAHVWDMEMTDTAGNVIPLVYGTIKVFREITRN